MINQNPNSPALSGEGRASRVNYSDSSSGDAKKKRRAKKLPVAVELDELVKIFKVARMPHHKLAYLIAWYSSCRISEVLNIEERDINWQDKTILVRQGKNNKDRIVPLPDAFRQEHLGMLPLSKICKARALQKAFRKDCLNAGLLEKKPTLHFHSLRHGFATHGITQGIDVSRIQVLMGHSNMATTSQYTHLKPQIPLDDYRRKF